MKLTEAGLLPLTAQGFGDAGVSSNWWLVRGGEVPVVPVVCSTCFCVQHLALTTGSSTLRVLRAAGVIK